MLEVIKIARNKISVHGLIAVACIVLTAACQAAPTLKKTLQSPWLFTIGTGFGSTNWTPLTSNVISLHMSDPDKAQDTGSTFLLGATLAAAKNFYINLEYQHFASARIHFADGNTYSDDMKAFTLQSKTNVMSVSAELRYPLFHSNLAATTKLGVAITHRQDSLNDQNRLGPLFGGGLSWQIKPSLFANIGFNYTAGYGKASLTPADEYIPFTYNVYTEIQYRI